MKEYMKKRYHRRRSEALEKLGGKCVVCGAEGNLEIDQINPKDKKYSIAKIWNYSDGRFEEELNKCQLLCRRCHEEKSIGDLGFKKVTTLHLVCKCGVKFDKKSNKVAKGQKNFYCSKECAGKYTREEQIKNGIGVRKKGDIPHGTKNGYSYHKCRCEECTKAATESRRKWKENREKKIKKDSPKGL